MGKLDKHGFSAGRASVTCLFVSAFNFSPCILRSNLEYFFPDKLTSLSSFNNRI